MYDEIRSLPGCAGRLRSLLSLSLSTWPVALQVFYCSLEVRGHAVAARIAAAACLMLPGAAALVLCLALAHGVFHLMSG
jgi:hypothetical protein